MCDSYINSLCVQKVYLITFCQSCGDNTGCNWWPCDRNFIGGWREDIICKNVSSRSKPSGSDEEYRYKVACLIKYRLGLCTTTTTSGPPCWPFAVVHISFFFSSYEGETPQRQHVSWGRGILTSLSCSINTAWLLCGTTLSVICPPESPLHDCHQGRWSGRSWRGQKRKWIILTVSSANTTSALHFTLTHPQVRISLINS